MAYLENMPYNKIHMNLTERSVFTRNIKIQPWRTYLAIAWSIQKGLSLIFPVETSPSVDNYL